MKNLELSLKNAKAKILSFSKKSEPVKAASTSTEHLLGSVYRAQKTNKISLDITCEDTKSLCDYAESLGFVAKSQKEAGTTVFYTFENLSLIIRANATESLARWERGQAALKERHEVFRKLKKAAISAESAFDAAIKKEYGDGATRWTIPQRNFELSDNLRKAKLRFIEKTELFLEHCRN